MELTVLFEPGIADEETTLDQSAGLEAFLRQVEGSAFRIALVSVRDRDEALDLVQDVMLRLATRYADRPPAEWKPLFFRILQNRIRDWGRRRAVSRRVLSFFGGQEGEDADPIVQALAPAAAEPLRELENGQAMASLEAALRQLSERQRQAFMLRCFENLDVAATAQAMGVSDGSVKTHYSRAVMRLRDMLGEHRS